MSEDPASVLDSTVLIPAAGNVPDGIVSTSAPSCPAMIPVWGRPVIYWTLTYLRRLGFRRFRIAVARSGLFVEQFVSSAVGAEDVEFVVVEPDRGIGATTLELLEGVWTAAALVVPAETYFEAAGTSLTDTGEPVALVSPDAESHERYLAEATADGHLLRLREKESGAGDGLHGLVGAYYFPDAQLARQAAEKASLDSARVDLTTIIRSVNEKTPIRLLEASSWVDVGNVERQSGGNRSRLLSRHFNELSLDATLGTVNKRSANAEKLIDEISYLRLLPPDVALLFPRIVHWSTDTPNPYVTMEYYGYPSLADTFLFENIREGSWRRVFEHLYLLLERSMWRHRGSLCPADIAAMYLDKPRSRLDAVSEPSALLELIRAPGTIRLNGDRMANLPALWPRLEAAVLSLKNVEATVIHGDLCFSNILYDLRSDIAKLIDPRGSFGRRGIYGDSRYDVAKLYHSVYGLYDCIVNDLFDVAVDGTDLQLEIRPPARHRRIRSEFEAVFFERFDRREILLLTGLIFVRLPVLHADSPARQLAFYGRAVQLLHEALA